jgi:hypothetical protein
MLHAVDDIIIFATDLAVKGYRASLDLSRCERCNPALSLAF